MFIRILVALFVALFLVSDASYGPFANAYTGGNTFPSHKKKTMVANSTYNDTWLRKSVELTGASFFIKTLVFSSVKRGLEGSYGGHHSGGPNGAGNRHNRHGQGRHQCRPNHHSLLEIFLKNVGQEFCSQFLQPTSTVTTMTTQTTSEVEFTDTLTSTTTSNPGTTTESTTTTDVLSETLTTTGLYLCSVMTQTIYSYF
jgi:hypothetical protein